MRNTILASVAALALTVPIAAQDMSEQVEAGATMQAPDMTAEQQMEFDAWPADRRMAYEGWPAAVQGYYWTLTPAQVEGWWALTDEQRVQVYEMTPEQRATAWASIQAQISGTATAEAMGAAPAQAPAPAPAPATGMGASATVASSGGINFVRGEVAQTAPAATPGAEYPPCRGQMTDGCVNPREAGLNYGNRPLDYWPGRPASEIDEPLPAEEPASTPE